ncbi:MAG TPA: hypothetical protein VIW67_09710 [Terriglobales bacterium]
MWHNGQCAKDKRVHESGTLLRMDSVECGIDENSGKSLTGELLGTDSAHKKMHALLCEEYVSQAKHITYRIRPRDEKHSVLLRVGARAQFRMDKDKMKLQVEGSDGKERDYTVISMTQNDFDLRVDRVLYPTAKPVVALQSSEGHNR